MPLLASDVLDEAASVYLNDSAKTRWTHAVLLPYLRSAVTELQAELESNDLPPIQEIAAIITVPPDTQELELPDDFVYPVLLEERAPGDTLWTKITDLHWEPDAEQGPKLEYYSFREGKIQFLGSTATREVRLKYLRSLSTVASANSNIELPNALGFLAARTASLASRFGGNATNRGTDAGGRADWFLHKLTSGLTKRLQGKPVRRRAYRGHRRY